MFSILELEFFLKLSLLYRVNAAQYAKQCILQQGNAGESFP